MKKVIFCDSCDAEFTLNYKSKDEPKYCVFCGDQIDLDWNADSENEDDVLI